MIKYIALTASNCSGILPNPASRPNGRASALAVELGKGSERGWQGPSGKRPDTENVAWQ